MSTRVSALKRVSWALFFALMALGVITATQAGCGRSALDDALLDGGKHDASVDAARDADASAGCGPATCPTGCCDDTGACRGGSELGACGGFGKTCNDCAAQGYTFCDPKAQACGTVVTACNAKSCPDGCCEGSTCLNGADVNECGRGGVACVHCALKGLSCDPIARSCGGAGCGPGTCDGCCVGDVCTPGTGGTACGRQGAQCQNCTGQGTTCAPTPPTGGICIGVPPPPPPPPTCGPQNCKGCCAFDKCLPGDSDQACGIFGAACTTCPAPGPACFNGTCSGIRPPPVSCDNCAALNGCCDPTLGCVGGFVDDRCGSGGAACTDCKAQGSTCDTNITPRVCKSKQTTCPAPYGACPGSLTTTAPPVQHVCALPDLQDARAACSGGPGTPGCQSFFQFINQAKPACGACLAPFDVPFQQGSGIFTCIAPFVGSACDHTTACAMDCQSQSCAQCPAAAQGQCVNDVRTGQCGTYFQQSQCIGQALFGAGSFCNPGNGAYQGNFGAWLEGVGAHYCGP